MSKKNAGAQDGKPKKVNVFLWKGVTAGGNPKIRIAIATLLALTCAALTFVQLGFAGVGFDGEYSAYIVVLLIPIAVGALLYGPLISTVLGLIAGGVLYVHAIYMPLDYYELTFVNLGTSVGMLTAAGFMLGLLFAIALRNDPPRIRRFIYTTIICLFVSICYSLSFTMNVIVSLAETVAESGLVDAVTNEVPDSIRSQIVLIAMRMGDVPAQIFLDALLMVVACTIADVISRKVLEASKNAGLRSTFAAWQFVVVLGAFMYVSVFGFIAATESGKAAAAVDMKSEVSYICEQLSFAETRLYGLLDLLDDSGLDEAELFDDSQDEFWRAFSAEGVLQGYSYEDDGLIIVSSDDTLVIADVELDPANSRMSDVFTEEILDAIKQSEQTGSLQRIVYDGIGALQRIGDAEIEGTEGIRLNTQIAYLYSETKGLYTVTAIWPSSKVFESRTGIVMWVFIASLVLLVVMYFLTARLLDSLVGSRIDKTNDTLSRITAGDLDTYVEVAGTREFKSLSTGINTTVDALKGWIAEAETRMDAELSTAKAIQEAALPRIFPPYPDILRFDVYAMMHAAREVGGDFYDFFLVGSDSGRERGRVGFVIADVSGKGVPAALFMMKAMTQIRDYMQSGLELGEAFENVNRQLCDGNDAGMFVTAWAGILDYETGHVDYVNAGHNPPLLWKYDGGWRWMRERSGLPLGLFDGLPYEAHSVDCEIGDQFLLYTDGVTEAMDAEGALYGEARLESVANANYALHPRELVEVVRADVAEFARDAEQSDDITILAFEVGVPPEITATLVVPARIDELPRVNSFIHNELDRRLCPLRTQNQLDIAVEELFVNVARYAYPEATPDNPGTVRISYSYRAEPPSITVDIADDGIPYDPTAKPDAVTPTNIEDVPIGGLGILMAKRSVDSMSYERRDGSNIVTLIKKW